MRKYIYEQDPGHGWLGVPEAELIQLGIPDYITDFSYWEPSRALVWLEEDCDMSTFLRAKALTEMRKAGFESLSEDDQTDWITNVFFPQMVKELHVKTTRIRDMPGYTLRREHLVRQARCVNDEYLCLK